MSEDIYTTNEYIKKNPTLHEEDSPWKIKKIIPLVDRFLKEIDKKEINILDVGGGAGLILKEISEYIRRKGIKVKKYSLDLSPGMLKIQNNNNPDIIQLLNEDIKKTSLRNKEIDLTLMIDVIEHVPNPEEALKELRRISKYVIFKVPLEDNLWNNTLNLINNGKTRKESKDKFGHINFYNDKILKNQVENNNGEVIYSNFTNVFNFFINDSYYANKRLRGKLFNIVANIFYNLSPNLASCLFGDFSMLLVKSNTTKMNDKKLKILMLNYEFPPLGGGASPVSYEIAKGYVKLGHSVDVVTMGFKDLPSYEVKDGINIYRVKCLRSKKEICHPWEQLTYIISAKKFLKKHMKTHTYDINHTHFIIPTGIIALWLKKKYNLPYIITSHGSDVPGFNTDRFKQLHKFTGPILRKVCKNAKIIIPLSQYLNTLIKENIGEYKVRVIPNGVYIDKFQPKAKKKIILSTGRLLPRKGFQYLIKAVSNKDYNYEVHIAGDGPMMQELRALAEESKTKIVFHGWMDNNSKEYKQLLEEASIYVLASEKENASIALLEAMSAGCAIITSSISGCPETIGNSGLIVEAKNSEQIRDAIESLVNNPKKMQRLEKLARKRIIKMFDWNKIIKEYEEVLR
jgi:glycosyltransferase involved in cell wall biosynthesis